jgi:integrase
MTGSRLAHVRHDINSLGRRRVIRREALRLWTENNEGVATGVSIFRSERMTPMSKDNSWNRNIKPKLDRIGMGWVNFLVMRRTHATLMHELRVSGKLFADQLGHGLEMNQNVYAQSPVENRLPAVNQLEKSPPL